jgi:hypothetical protein
MTFAEGWAHYAEEMCLEEGFGAYAAERLGDPAWTADHFEIGVWLEALIRVTRLSVAIGMHTGTMSVEEAAARFAQDTPLQGPAALLGPALAGRGGADLDRVARDLAAARLLGELLELVRRLVDRLQMALVLELAPGRGDVRMPDLGEPAARELDVALAERRLDLKQQDGLLDVQHLWHDPTTVAVGLGPGARPYAPGRPLATTRSRRMPGGGGVHQISN